MQWGKRCEWWQPFLGSMWPVMWTERFLFFFNSDSESFHTWMLSWGRHLCLGSYYFCLPFQIWILLLDLFFKFSSVQSLSRVRLFATQWIAARQASLSITNSWSSLRLTSIESVMPYSHLIPCRPLRLLPPIPSSIRVFSNESTLHMRWPKYWSFSFSIIPSKEIPGPISFRMDWLDLLAFQGTLKSSPTPQFKSINSLALSCLHSLALTSIHDHWKNHSLD